LAALEDRLDADLAIGEHAGLVSELEALVRRYPLRERLHGQLMLALYRSGRQADALERYQQARRKLTAELGIEPGPALQQLERGILAQDPALEPPSGASAIERVILHATRRTGAIVTAGALLLLCAAIAAALVVSSGGGAAVVSLRPNSLGLVDPATRRVRASVPVAGTPARVHVSGQDMGVTSDDARTVLRLDAGSLAIARVLPVGAFPSDFAVGEGWVWVLDRQRGRLLKISPDYRTVVGTTTIGSTETLSTTDDRNVPDPWSVATGAGALWITDGSRLLRRAEPATGRIVRAYDLHTPITGVAVGGGMVWAISGPSASVLRIDPRGSNVTRIRIVARPGLESPYPIGVAVGLGSVWVLNANSASVTRIDPVEAGVTATISIGIARQPLRLAVGAGAAWVADGDGTLARIDATTNGLVTTPIAPSLHDVGVGAGGIWVTSGAPLAGGSVGHGAAPGGHVTPLPASRCSPIYSAPGARPRYLLVSDLPLQGDLHDIGAQTTAAIAFALRERGFRAGRFVVGYQACNNATVSNFLAFHRCATNTRAYAADSSVIGVIGPFNSGCATAEIAIANSAPGGPLAMISASTTGVGLTHRGPGAHPGEPDKYYPTHVRNYVRIVAADDVQAAADAVLARQMGLRRIFVSDDAPDPYGTGIAGAFTLAARRLGVGVSGTATWPNNARGIPAFVRKVARSHPDSVFLGGAEHAGVGPLVRALRAAMPNVQFLAPDGFAFFPDTAVVLGSAAEGMTVSQPQIIPSLLRGPGKEFVARFGKQIGGSFYPSTAYAAQAVDVMLDAIAHSDGTRRSVTRALFASRVRDGIIGSFAVTPTGDTTAGAVTIIRVEHGKPVPVRVITPPASLTAGG
jgi:branched-chain amino acid transport system substrate-binding protein